MPTAPPGTGFSLVLTLAVEMEMVGSEGVVEAAKYVGSAKVVAAA